MESEIPIQEEYDELNDTKLWRKRLFNVIFMGISFLPKSSQLGFSIMTGDYKKRFAKTHSSYEV